MAQHRDTYLELLLERIREDKYPSGELMERQAVRRIEGGTLTPDEIERLGQTFMKLERRMEELKAEFDLEDSDLNLNLGPLGDLL